MRIFRRSKTERKIAGLCGGLATLLDFDVVLIRFCIIIATFLYPPLPLVYLIAWFVIPVEATSKHVKEVSSEPQILQE